MREKRVLMIAYFFPPVGGSGALRPMKLAKYLPSFGWLPMVLTVKNPDWYYAHDFELLAELPESVKIMRSKMIQSGLIYRALNPIRLNKLDRWIRRWIIHPDPQIGWIPSGISCGLRMIEKEKNIRIIYSTSAPLSAHLIAHRIKEKTGLPWVADFRDEWLENPDIHIPSTIHRKIHYMLEQKIVRNADHVVAAAPGFCEFLKKHSFHDKISTLTMGFDPEDFEAGHPKDRAPGDNDKFTIVFSGLFYGSFRPTIFLEAVTSLIDVKKIDVNKIKIVFVGANQPEETRFEDVHQICEFTGFVSHRKAIEYISKSDTLLLLLSKERGDYVIPSKTFEYLASEKPIIGLVPEGSEVASIIKKTGSGFVVDINNLEGIRSVITHLYNDWETKKHSFKHNMDHVQSYNQIEITGKFADLLNRLTDG